MKNVPFSVFCFVLFILSGAGTSMFGAEWTGATSSSWINPFNWNPQNVPASSQSLVVQIPGSIFREPILDVPVTLQGIEVVPPAGTAAGILISGDSITFANSEPYIRNTSGRFVTLTTPITIPSDDLQVTTSSIRFHGPISGAGGLEIESETFSSFGIEPPTDNSYQGLTRVGGRASVTVSGSSIGIPGDLLLDEHARVVLRQGTIAQAATATILGSGRLDINGANSMYQIVDSADSSLIVTQSAQNFTLLANGPTEFVGYFYVGGHFHKASDAPLILSGTVTGYGTVEADTYFSAIFEPPESYLPIFTWKGNFTIRDGSSFIVTPSVGLNRAYMCIEGGALTIQEDATVILEVRDAGAFGSGEFPLWEWDENTQTPPDVEQFVVVGVPDDFQARLEVVDSTLLLVVTGPRLNLRVHLFKEDHGALMMKVSNAVNGLWYSLEKSYTLEPDSWQHLDDFDGRVLLNELVHP